MSIFCARDKSYAERSANPYLSARLTQSMSLPKTLATLPLGSLINHIRSLHAFFSCKNCYHFHQTISSGYYTDQGLSHPLRRTFVALFLGLSPVSIHLVPHSRRPTFPVTIPVLSPFHCPNFRNEFGEWRITQAREDFSGELLSEGEFSTIE